MWSRVERKETKMNGFEIPLILIVIRLVLPLALVLLLGEWLHRREAKSLSRGAQ
jgi:hypothetical protein